MNKLKLLQETRGGLVKQARNIIDSAKTESGEVRALTGEEVQKIQALEGEIDGLAASIDIEMRQLARESTAPIQFSKQEERDVAKFTLGKVVRHLDRVFRGQPSTVDGIEAEMIAEGEKEAFRSGVNANGISLPSMLLRNREQRANLSVTGGTSDQYGGALVATEKRGILGDFYNRGVLESSGAMVLPGLIGNLDLPRYVQGTAPVKKTENEAAGDVAGTFTDLNLSPKRLAGFAVVSDQLLAQSNENVEAFVSGQIGQSMLAVKERAFFHGTGTSEPTGIAATSGIGSVVGGTNGASPDWADVVNLWKEVSTDNADAGALGYFTNSKVVGKFLQTPKVASTDSRMIMEDLNAGLLGFRVGVTNAIKSDLTKGSSSVASAIFYGNAADFVIGYWGGINLEMVRDSTDAKAGQRHLVANTYYDAGVLRAQSFSAMLDALTA